MQKKVRFYMNNAKAIRISNDLDRFGLQLLITAKDSYTYEKMQEIINQIKEKGIEINIDFKGKKIQKFITDKKCSDCVFFSKKYGCGNSSAKVRNKATKTSNTKGCYWGEWN